MSLHLPTIAEEDNVSFSSGMSLSGLETVRASNIRRGDEEHASSSTTNLIMNRSTTLMTTEETQTDPNQPGPPLGLEGNVPPGDVAEMEDWRREEENDVLFFCTALGYSATADAFQAFLFYLARNDLSALEMLMFEKENRRPEVTWQWPFLIPTPAGRNQWKVKPKNLWKRFRLKNDVDGQWKYIVSKFINVLRNRRVGADTALPFHDKVNLLVQRCESDAAAVSVFAEVLRHVGFTDLFLGRVVYSVYSEWI